MPKLSIVKGDKKFQIVDEDGSVYGRYDTKAEADTAIEDWNAYYAN